MALYYRIGLCAVLLSLIPLTASAADIFRYLEAWEGRIAASSPTLGSTEVRVTGGSKPQCTAALNARMSQLQAQGYKIVLFRGCFQIINGFFSAFEDFPDLLPKFEADFCLACLLMKPEFITRIYPAGVSDAVNVLKDKYRIDDFNQELQNLRQRYNTDGFRQELYQLELKNGARIR